MNKTEAIARCAQELERRGELTAENLVDAARPEESSTHNCFEWNDSEAAEKYRITQARQWLRVIKVEDLREEGPPGMRAFLPVTVQAEGERPRSSYQSVGRIKTRQDFADQAMENVHHSLQSWLEVYRRSCQYFEVGNSFSKVAEIATQTISEIKERKRKAS